MISGSLHLTGPFAGIYEYREKSRPKELAQTRADIADADAALKRGMG